MTITSFRGKYSFLSNFATIDILVDSKLWKTSEHIYMACKTTDPKIQEQIRLTKTPGQAKRKGRSVILRSDWEQIKDDVMHYVLWLKFSLNPDMKKQLLETKEQLLIEGNRWHDNYWGSCKCSRCNNQGKNRLGLLLMQLRTQFKGELR